MAESSILWETDGTGDGTGSGYTDEQMFQLFRSFCPNANVGGVAMDILNELEVTGTSSPVAVNTGQALVYGIPYFNSASVNVAIATPASDTRVDRIVLRASWAAQTVRITRIAGTEGAGTPSMTQTPGTTWDVPLATVSITTGGVITVTDAREYVAAGAIIDGSITSAKLASYAVNPRTQISGTDGIVVDPQNGNARGTDAVDLQTSRAADTQVASGQFAVIAGGVQNTASATDAAVGGGTSNVASGIGAVVPGGLGAKADKLGQLAHASGTLVNVGDAQRSVYVPKLSTTNNTPAEMFLGPSSRMTIASDTTWAFRILLVARRADADGESAAYEFVGCIDNNAGTTALVGSVTKTVVAEDTAGWDADVTADNTNDALIITVTGENAKTIYWVATVWTSEVTG